jgi:hypothetical protein
MAPELSRQISGKYSTVRFRECLSRGCRGVPLWVTDRQTDMTKLIVAFRNLSRTAASLLLAWNSRGIKVYEHKKLVHPGTCLVGFSKWVLHQHFKNLYINFPSEIQNDCLQISKTLIADLLTRLEAVWPTYEVTTTGYFQNSPFTSLLRIMKEYSTN